MLEKILSEISPAGKIALIGIAVLIAKIIFLERLRYLKKFDACRKFGERAEIKKTVWYLWFWVVFLLTIVIITSLDSL